MRPGVGTERDSGFHRRVGELRKSRYARKAGTRTRANRFMRYCENGITAAPVRHQQAPSFIFGDCSARFNRDQIPPGLLPDEAGCHKDGGGYATANKLL